MAYPGPYGNTTIPTQAGGGGHWYDFLAKLLSGLKNAGTAVPAGAGAALSSVGDKLQLPEVLKILGSIGKGTGQVATSIGRQLPYAGPLVQAGEYGILNAVGKQDSPWAQGNAFIQRDTVQKQRNALAELVQQLQQQNITKGEQDIEKQLYEKGRRPFEEQKGELGLLGDYQAYQQGEQTYQKGEYDLQQKEGELNKLKDELQQMEAYRQRVPFDQEAELQYQQVLKRIDLLDAQIAKEKSYATWNTNRLPGNSNIDTTLQKEAWDRAIETFPGLGTLKYKYSGFNTLTPQQRTEFSSHYNKILNDMIAVKTRQQNVSGGWSMSGGKGMGGGSSLMGGFPTTMPSGSTVQPLATAGAPDVITQVQLFWQRVGERGTSPEDELGELIALGSSGKPGLNPADAGDAEVIAEIKKQIAARMK